MEEDLKTICLEENGKFVIQCLQYDIAAQGDTPEAAQTSFEYTVATEFAVLISQGKTLEDLPPAPKYYWDLYDQIINTPQ